VPLRLKNLHALMTENAPSPACPAPVVLLVFNRPVQTRQLLEAVRRARPPLVLVVADGPRPAVPGDDAACAEVRALVDQEVDWDAKVLKNYAAANLGLRRRVSSGLAWAFEQVEQAIILEDDCLPDPTFFRFCAELLHCYQYDTRVGVISGNNFQPPGFACQRSYYFSRYNHCWGWATWRRAWQFFDASMKEWPELRPTGWLDGLFPDPAQAAYWRALFDGVCEGRLNSWAYAWTFACWSQSLLTILPRANLVSNIGFDSTGTHTTNAANPLAQLPSVPMPFPLTHPSSVVLHYAADDYTQRHIFGSAPSPAAKEPAPEPAVPSGRWWDVMKHRWLIKKTMAVK
jgi:hypothetical protein